MASLSPVLRKMRFVGPFAGCRHLLMVKDEVRFAFPTPTKGKSALPCCRGFSSRPGWNEMSGSGVDVSGGWSAQRERQVYVIAKSDIGRRYPGDGVTDGVGFRGAFDQSAERRR